MTPAVSVLLPVYNAEKYLSEAVDSVLNQTFRDFEVIAVDDGSTDRSKAILDGYAKADPRVRIISRPNRGLVASLNEAFGAARAPLIARMDADDACRPERFQKQVDFLTAHPSCVLLGTAVMTMDPAGFLIGRMKDIAFGHEAIEEGLLQRGWPMVHPTIMMRADALRKVGAYRAETWPYEDHDLFLRMTEVGQVDNLPDVLLNYRKHPASISAKNAGTRDDLLIHVIAEACRRRGLPVHPKVTALRGPTEPIGTTEKDWAWEAVKSRNVATARKYALHTLRRYPFSLESWRLTYCAVRGR